MRWLAALLAPALFAQPVRVAVFGLFHPREVRVEHLDAGVVRLSVPGRIDRLYQGSVQLVRDRGEVVPVVTMDLETAVASIVAAESAPGAAIESLKAQAVVARSFLLAGGARHAHSDFCDTTHCQFLRAPPPAASLAWQAAHATRGLVLTHGHHPIAALYSADCGGQTRTAWSGGYPYRAVRCVRRSGRVAGHQLGLCQNGAAAMAQRGAGFREILGHYYPAAAVSLYE